MKLLMTALSVAMSTAVWANEPIVSAPEAVAQDAPPMTAPVVAQPAPVTVPASTADTAVMLPPEAKEEIILNNPANLQALKTLIGPELMQAAANHGVQPAAAGGVAASMMPVNAAMAAGRQQVQVRPGETLDRILARTLGRTPFAAALVRKTVVDMNPTAFMNGSPHRLNAGATLVLPSLQDLQAVAGGASPSTALMHSPGGGAGHSHAADDRRNWIRYP
jgi:Tfp pilus assembly protein FimV